MDSAGTNPMLPSYEMISANGQDRHQMMGGGTDGATVDGVHEAPPEQLCVDSALRALLQALGDCSQPLAAMREECEKFTVRCHDNAPVEHDQMSVQLGSVLIDFSLQLMLDRITELYKDISMRHSSVFEQLCTVQSRVLNVHLVGWKQAQRLAGNGCSINCVNLCTLQKWCEHLVEAIIMIRNQLKQLQTLTNSLRCQPIGVDLGVDDSHLVEFISMASDLLSRLVTSSLVIEKQPPQVLKTNIKFSASLRFLAGMKLNLLMLPPEVKVTIINQAQTLHQIDKCQGPSEMSSGLIINNTNVIEHNQDTMALTVNFKHMQLKKIKRSEKKNNESVMDEKFCLLFQCQFSIFGGEFVFYAWTLSLPVVVIVHGNQEPHALSTVLWENAFYIASDKHFSTLTSVSWSRLSATLSHKFHSFTDTHLSTDMLDYLANKLLSPSDKDNVLLDISWQRFARDTLFSRSFSFWEWLYAIMKLIREHLKQIWIDGLITGFISRADTENLLINCQDGTFLLRFSDSELGGITVAFVATEQNQRRVFMLSPFTSKDFAMRSLPDRLHDLTHLMYLYPEHKKNECFGKYYTDFRQRTVGKCGDGLRQDYVKPILITHIPGFGNSQQLIEDRMKKEQLKHAQESGCCQIPDCQCLPKETADSLHVDSPSSALLADTEMADTSEARMDLDLTNLSYLDAIINTNSVHTIL